MHPLRKKAKLYHIYPCIKCFYRIMNEKEDFKENLRYSILEEMGMITGD